MRLYPSLASWVWLPLVLLLGERVTGNPETSSSQTNGSPKSRRGFFNILDLNSTRTQASFIVPCPNCLGPHSPTPPSSPPSLGDNPLDFSFDFGVLPGTEPCASNLSINSIPLESSASSAHWNFEPSFAQGSTAINVDGHDLIVSWVSACNSTLRGSPTKVFTLSVTSINGNPITTPPSLAAGFTVSFKDVIPPELLRYSLHPTSPSDIDDAWFESDDTDTDDAPDEPLDQTIDQLHRIEADIAHLQKELKTQKKLVSSQLHRALREDIKSCEGPVCVFKAILHHVHTSFKVFIQGYKAADDQPTSPYLHSGHQVPTMIEKEPAEEVFPASLPPRPDACHCRGGRFGSRPPRIPDEKNSIHDPQFRHLPPSNFKLVLRFLFVFSGLALVFALLRCCCMSPRKRRDRAARREQRRAERLYSRAAKRQRFWDWMRGRKRGHPGRKVGDCEEKSALVDRQQLVLDEAMEDEIRQLKIHEEINHIRNTRDAVDELIRAEEGRAVAPPSYPHSTRPGESGDGSRLPMLPNPAYYSGFTPIQRQINIPPPLNHHNFARRDEDVESGMSSPESPIFSPLSRTTSLPSYRSKPPSYHEDDDQDSFSDCSITVDDDERVVGHLGVSDVDDEGWGSEHSSVPDLSPRPSGETIRTFV